ncbi:UPF0061 protein ORF18 [Nymphon striatum]|nr:UPF0061 protein ORF18 [Nymphon striatum]
MKCVNPKYSLREWFVVPAYKEAAAGNYALTRELQDIMTQPYAEQSKEIEEKYDKLKPSQFFEAGGTSHYNRLSSNPRSPHHVEEIFEHNIGIRLNGKERNDVGEYCISEGWVKVTSAKALDRRGQPLLITIKGTVEAYYTK